MRGISIVAAAMAIMGIALDVVGPASAQSGPGYGGPTAEGAPPPRRSARRPTQIQVTPDRQLVRLCEDWLAVENRPSGTVIVPQMRCRWGYR
ncbi:hypothetical protein [Rhodoplanes roseus]|uniref:Uncharacterized protein n=1 Tax=Rhodoplanes roseus TaxID=29409 RepID=A0A327L4T6_9BRAD|nr:hypothetical protein [Rhodoplanes roseus]RAI46050.1 hypothetical protein CH341_01045 [Rhodoplanes roseus]